MEKFIKEFLSSLGSGSKDIVFVSISTGSGIEMIQIDGSSKSVKNYGFRPLAYNESMREIADYDELKHALDELFKELKINPKCTIYMSLPIVHWGKIDLPLILGDEAITGAITSEVEQAYLFKKSEPVISWFDVLSKTKEDSRTIIYTAMQKEVVDKIKTVVASFGANLKFVENSIISILRGLYFTNSADSQMQEGVNWNLMIVNSFGYSIISMSDKNIIDYYEEPIAFKTYDANEVYDAINTSAQLALMNYPANSLYIVSETDMISAELLSKKIQADYSINYFEDNAYKKVEIIPVSLDILPDKLLKISLKAIGLAACKQVSYPVSVDFSGNNISAESSSDEDATLSLTVNNKEIVLDKQTVRMICSVIAGILIVPVLVAWLWLPNIEKTKKTALDKINKEIGQIEDKIRELSEMNTDTGFNVDSEIETVLKNNRNKLIAYSALGENIPKDLWLTYFKTQGAGEINVQGVSDNVENVYKFYKNIKDSLLENNLHLQKLEMQSASIDAAISSGSATNYQFEITNIEPQAAESSDEDNENKDNKGKKDNKEKKDNNQNNNKKEVKDLEPVDESSLK